MPARLDAVLHVLYLVYSEGYSATSGDAVVRTDLTRESIRLGRLLLDLLPEEGEVAGLLALMLLHDTRRLTRTTTSGEIALLAEQDRSRWDRAEIAEGARLVERAMRTGRIGPYTVQAAIAALHAEAPSAEATDWAQITGLYDVLLRIEPTPIVELNRAVAVAMRDGAEAGLALMDGLLARGELDEYHLAHAARADLLARLGRREEAIAAYDRARSLVKLEPERRFLERRLTGLLADWSTG
jgi:RNA polymerase sigma-70 factor (ECF subfamily)